ncbi:MAG: histidine phosphatase family protein [Candidatus Algichlamydia australiensis]|nr:histidine phosphatase family protein [Chlamydiales bacterium]
MGFANIQSLVLVRHGEGEHNVKGIWSQTAPLTEVGVEQVFQTGKDLLEQGLSSEKVSVVYVSPMPRTRQTAQALIDSGVIREEQLVFDERLAEIDAGSLEGEKFRPWGDADLWDLPFAEEVGGETLAQVRDRIGSFLSELSKQEFEHHVFVISHGSPLRELLGLLGHERIKLNTAEAKIIPKPPKH